MRSLLLLPFASVFALVACGRVTTTDKYDPTPPATTSSTSTTSPTDPPPTGSGWTIRDDTPYARIGHSAVLDEAGDRMVVFGGGANDTWVLPLSGPHENEWSQLLVTGEHPPVHTYGGSLYADSAVYDPARERMIVLLNATPATAQSTPGAELWELSLSGTPAWRRLVTEGPSPGAELQSGRIVLDRDGDRLFAVGGALDDAGVWTLSLDDPPTWSRLADTPDEPMGAFYADASLAFDAKRQQLLFFGGHPRLGRIHSLSLEDGQWTVLDEGTGASDSYGVGTTLDAAGDRLVLFGGDINSGIALFSLETHEWTQVALGTLSASHRAASVVTDPSRGRVLAFSGVVNQEVDNTTWAFSLGDLQLSELVPPTRKADFNMGQRAAVWDPTRAAVIVFGDYQGGDTWSHGLAPGDTWVTLPAGTTPSVSFFPAVHDPAGDAIIAFGGYQYVESSAVVRLASSPGAEWETVPVAAGPAPRSQHAAILDAAGARLIIHGGWNDSSYPPTKILGDVWALSLDGSPSWTELAPEGKGPTARSRHTAIYDPDARRMVLYGGADYEGTSFTETWTLSLDDTPEWTLLAPTGTGPGPVTHASAVHDPEGKRMILVDLVREGARVFALDLDGPPEWHRFCWNSLTPAESWDFPGSAPDIVLAPDGLFVTLSGGAFRFDLATSYCE